MRRTRGFRPPADWDVAIRLLSSAGLRDTRNADIQNYLGYAYQRALQLNPRHRGAHEYIGEAYLIANDLANAEKHLTALEKMPDPVRGVRRLEEGDHRVSAARREATGLGCFHAVVTWGWAHGALWCPRRSSDAVCDHASPHVSCARASARP